jgi:hypothetical protein
MKRLCLPVLCQPSRFIFGVDRVFDHKVKTERLVRRDDDLFRFVVRWKRPRKGGAVHLFLGAQTSSSTLSYHDEYER